MRNVLQQLLNKVQLNNKVIKSLFQTVEGVVKGSLWPSHLLQYSLVKEIIKTLNQKKLELRSTTSSS